MSELTAERIVTTGEAAARTGMDPRTIRKGVEKWIAEGDVPGAIPGFRTPGGHYRVDIDALLTDSRANVTPIVRGGAGLAGRLRKVS